MREHKNSCYIWKFVSDVAKKFGEMIFEKMEDLQRMYELNNIFATQQFRSFW